MDQKFKVIKKLGEGSYGSVWRASNKQSGEIVAVKALKMKYSSWRDCRQLREYKSLRDMNHINIVQLKELIMENSTLYFVFENMDCSLLGLMEDRCRLHQFFSENEVRNYCFQLFNGLAHMHQHGYIHRDLKPDNFLVSESKDVIKLADFGMVREIGLKPPFTEYVTTRWYRAPEVLLKSNSYGTAIDMWAMGAIMAELFNFKPLFPGSSEADQIHKICCVVGSPTESEWADGVQLARELNCQFPDVRRRVGNLFEVIPHASKNAISLISLLLSWDPSKRPTALEALSHPFFKSCYDDYVHQPYHLKLPFDLNMAPPSSSPSPSPPPPPPPSPSPPPPPSPSDGAMNDFPGHQTPVHNEFIIDLNMPPQLIDLNVAPHLVV